jgi:hypothetical protein
MKRAVSLGHLSSQNKCLALLSSCFPKLQTVITTKVGFNYTCCLNDMYFTYGKVNLKSF